MTLAETLHSLPTLHSHEDAILWFISQFDWEMVSDLLDDHRSYEDLPKQKFIATLRTTFEQMQSEGDERLLVFSGRCHDCNCSNYKKNGYIFCGNHTKQYFALLVETDEHLHVTDLYQCFNFAANSAHADQLGKRIYLPPSVATSFPDDIA